MLRYLTSLLGARYHPLNTIELSVPNLIHNYHYLSNLEKDILVAPVLKSNAYGHGLIEVAKILDPFHPPFFCVDSLYEAYALHKAGIATPILIMGYVHPDNLRVKKLPFSFAVYDIGMLEALKEYQPHAPLHVFVDTGMHREGVLVSELHNFLLHAQELSLHIDGLMSHFAMGDNPRNSNTRAQVKEFIKAKEIMREVGILPQWIHASASLGFLHSQDYPGVLGNVVRSGIALYGIDPENKNPVLKPVLELTSTLVQIKTITKGERVGYDFTYTAKENMKIGILPLGYHDGVDRRLSDVGFVTIDGVLCPIIGKVSMNLTTIDITHLSHSHIGQKVVVYSKDSKDKNSIGIAAQRISTIPYELLVHLTPSTRRVVISNIV